MKIISINDPNDLYYPLDKETYWDPGVYYHGTGVQFSTSIEKNGFNLEKVYDNTDVTDLYNSFASTYFQKMTREEKKYQREDLSFAIGGAGHSISFSGNYWQARNYSTFSGGESIEHIVNVSKWISNLPGCPFHELAEKCLEKYEPIFENHIPCVYAVRLSDDELKEFEDSYKQYPRGTHPIKNVDRDHFVFNNIPKESIIARIDFSREIEKWNPKDTHNGPYPTKF